MHQSLLDLIIKFLKFKAEIFALKIRKKSEVIYLKQVEHVKTEKKLLETISHPFIVNLMGAFQDEKNLYLMLEYIIGGEFFSHLRKAGRFPNDTSRFYAAQIALVVLGQASGALLNAALERADGLGPWRLTMGLAAAPPLAQLAIFASCLPESPRVLLATLCVGIGLRGAAGEPWT